MCAEHVLPQHQFAFVYRCGNEAQWESTCTLRSGACGSRTHSMKFNYPTLPGNARKYGHVTRTPTLDESKTRTRRASVGSAAATAHHA